MQSILLCLLKLDQLGFLRFQVHLCGSGPFISLVITLKEIHWWSLRDGVWWLDTFQFSILISLEAKVRSMADFLPEFGAILVGVVLFLRVRSLMSRRSRNLDALLSVWLSPHSG